MYSSLHRVLSKTTKEAQFNFQQRHEIFLFSKTSRLPLMPTQVYICNSYQMTLPWEGHSESIKLATHLYLVLRFGMH
jgi:hypothetical protein